jgi:hypothetical protein
MKSSPRPWLVAAAVSLAAIGVTSACRTGPDNDAPDVWPVGDLDGGIVRNLRYHAELDARSAVVRRRIAAKKALVEELIAGRVGLAEVAAYFRALNADQPVYAAVILAHWPGDSDDEKYCRNVICHVESALVRDARRGPVVRRLTDELDRMISAGGVRLPDVPVDEGLTGPGSLIAGGPPADDP